MDEAERQRLIEQALRARRVTTEPVVRDYSLAQVQLTDASVVSMTIIANPTIGAHLTKEMASTGFLYLYNETESLLIRADRVVAVNITKLTKG